MEGMEANRPRSDKLAEILLCILCAGLSSHKRSSLIQLSDCPEEFKENKQINFDKMVLDIRIYIGRTQCSLFEKGKGIIFAAEGR